MYFRLGCDGPGNSEFSFGLTYYTSTTNRKPVGTISGLLIKKFSMIIVTSIIVNSTRAIKKREMERRQKIACIVRLRLRNTVI